MIRASTFQDQLLVLELQSAHIEPRFVEQISAQRSIFHSNFCDMRIEISGYRRDRADDFNSSNGRRFCLVGLSVATSSRFCGNRGNGRCDRFRVGIGFEPDI